MGREREMEMKMEMEMEMEMERGESRGKELRQGDKCIKGDRFGNL